VAPARHGATNLGAVEAPRRAGQWQPAVRALSYTRFSHGLAGHGLLSGRGNAAPYLDSTHRINTHAQEHTMSTLNVFTTRKAWTSFGVAALLAATAASAQIATGTTGIDASGNTQAERTACMTGNTQQDRATCLKEANNAAADKRRGVLESGANYTSNALARCDVLSGEDKAACQARIAGYGNATGSVAGGGVIREVETVMVPADATSVVIEPKTSDPVLVITPAQ